MQTLETLLLSFSEAFYADDFQKQIILENAISSMCLSDSSLSDLTEKNAELQKFKEDAEFYEQSLLHLRNSDWDLISDLNDIKVESHFSGADFYTRASVLINSSIFETLAVITEEDLLPSWIHALSQVTVLSAPAKFKKLMRYSFWFPWPLSDRECYLEFSGYPVPEDQAMLIVMRSPKQDYLDLKLPEINPNVQRMSVPLGCLLVQYISPELTKVCILVQASATTFISQSSLPEWLLNFGKKQMMYFLMDALRLAVMNFRGSEYENRVQRKVEYYEFLRKVLRFEVEIG